MTEILYKYNYNWIEIQLQSNRNRNSFKMFAWEKVRMRATSKQDLHDLKIIQLKLQLNTNMVTN